MVAKRIRDPAKTREYTRRYHERHRERIRITRRARYQASDRRALQLRYAYALTVEQYTAMVQAQDGRCAICQRPTLEIPKQILNVDHDHMTNEIRGLLCFDCNTGLGKFRDNPTLLKSALEYMNTWYEKRRKAKE